MTLDSTAGLRVAIYSHDAMGLGHVRRNLLIAQTLANSELEADVLVVSGTCEAARFATGRGVDAVTLPSVAKNLSSGYETGRLRTDLSSLLELRTRIIDTTLTEFAPQVFIVDNVPMGVGRELEGPLARLRARPDTRCVLGLRDVSDAPDRVRAEWERDGTARAIRDHYDAIWIYGDPRVYERIEADAMPADIAQRATFVGYLDQRRRSTETDLLESAHFEQWLAGAHELILCLVGGGQDGASVIESFGRAALPKGAVGLIVAGPFRDPLRADRLQALQRERSDLRIVGSVAGAGTLVARASRVVAMGGYNTIGEILAHQKRALIIPRSTPRMEQTIRADRLAALGLIDTVPTAQASAEFISRWLASSRGETDERFKPDMGALDRIPRLCTELLSHRKEEGTS